ncbi:hypothetical protein PM082_000411 [Marasmius tenuissimus]|nr:hypothetical protein PM082_000411 [Marasmius tenuissimus]
MMVLVGDEGLHVSTKSRSVRDFLAFTAPEEVLFIKMFGSAVGRGLYARAGAVEPGLHVVIGDSIRLDECAHGSLHN